MTDLPAGDALDVLVAEKVMGWRRPDPDARDPKYPLSPRDSQGRWYNGEEELDEFHATPEGAGGGDYYQPDESWSPSTDIRAAWEVVEKLGSMRMRRDGIRDTSGQYHIGVYFLLEYNALYDQVNPMRVDENGLRYRTSEDPPAKPVPEPWHYTIDDAPLAICRAALAAVQMARLPEEKP